MEAELASVTPFNVDNFPFTVASFVLPVSTPLPYTASVEAMPFGNGGVVGTGFLAMWNCDGSGGGTFSLVQVAAPTPVPATSAPTLAALATLIALAGLALARRRARLRPIP